MALWLLASKRILRTCLNYRNFSSPALEYKNLCKILGISENSDQEDIRKAYLELVKKYHPDSASGHADPSKFAEIDEAFKALINLKSKERWGVESEEAIEEQEIQHVAPQHRQFLSYDGTGVGTPFERQRQFDTQRAVKAAENVLHHRISKATAEEGALLAKNSHHKIKSQYGVDRLVEDLIQESISKGEFNNLSGVGKPLKKPQNENPYVDFVTHKLNEVLIDNGFQPEWIQLQKRIRFEIQDLKESLIRERANFGVSPLSEEDQTDWMDLVKQHTEISDQINSKIDKFNLLVPLMNKQMMRVNLGKEAQKVLEDHRFTNLAVRKKKKELEEHNSNERKEAVNIFEMIDLVFKKK